ncbi:zinc transporter 6-like isoform X2 [Phymastichus coffea]|uniref:zinc transporter 6-like isoform X2 n=1 Tax=Phymastichus coffea TaxID=108790 RepID=UPI00273C709D|nr:zinc transporter 6-like isoform X2 [Phymastichus coffea]
MKSKDESGSSATPTNDVEAAIENPSGLWVEMSKVLRQADSKWILLLMPCNGVVVYYLWIWSTRSESLALRAYANALAFDVCALAVCLVSVWVEQNTGWRSRCGPSVGQLGLERYELFGLLASSCLCLSAQALLFVDALARSAQRQSVLVHEGRLGLGAVVGVVAHLVTIVVYPDASLNHVVCKALPCPTFNGINPILAANLISFTVLCGSHLTIHFWQLYITDIVAAFVVIALTVASMLPLAFYTVSIIFRNISHHMSEQLQRCLQEALIIDGVLEFRNERFWTKSFGKLGLTNF